jgi:hypothetical protein
MPFTAEQFFEVFARYNQSVFPMQFALVWAASAAVLLAIKQKTISDEIISGILAFLWLWAGIVYHLVFFTGINSGAYIFGAMFVVQGALFYYEGIVRRQLSFRLKPDFYGIWGVVFIAYALVVYPVAGYSLGHVFPSAPTFGAPCPLVIFTFGMLMLANKRMSLYLLIIPLVWAIIASTAAWNFGVAEDIGLSITALIVTFLVLRREFALDEEEVLYESFKNAGGRRGTRRARRV